MNIAVGDRVRALDDCRMAGRGTSRYFYRAGDTGTAVRFDGLGAWVKWDGNRIDDGVWYANTEILALIEEDTSGIDWAEGHTHPHEMSSGCHCVQCRPHERPCGCNGCRSLTQQPTAVVGVEQVASAIAIEDTGVSWHDVSPRDRAHYVKLARAALAAQQGGEVHELRLCESSRLFLRPDRLYRFTVDPDCSMCREAASYYAQKGGDA